MMGRTARTDGAADNISSNARNKMAADLQALISDAEELLRSTGRQAEGRYDTAKRRFESTLQTAKSGLSAFEGQMLKNTRQAAETTDQYVQQHPWQSVGFGAAVGLMLGMMIGRR